MTGTNDTGTPTDPLDAVAVATTVWKKASMAWPQRTERDRRIIAAFDSGATGREISAASGLELDVVYKVHSEADMIRAETELDRRMAETSRSADALGNTATGPGSSPFDESITRILERTPADAEVVRGIAPDHADKMMEFYEKHRAAYGL